jgi:alpha-beta hydrolase superfamily lysophospholipase
VRCRTIPVVFGLSDRGLVGFYHSAEGAPTRGPGVVLCNPLGYETMSIHRTYRHLADRLAARGFPAMRFDYDGTGDSAGQANDPDRVQAWLASIGAAIEEVRARSGAFEVGLFGVRMGATLAMLAAAQRSDIECLIAWAPVVSGSAHVRELRAFRVVGNKGLALMAKRSDGSEEVRGYFYSRETLAELSAINLLVQERRPAQYVLVVSRHEKVSGEEAHFADYLSDLGADSRLVSGTRYARMMRDDPYESIVPSQTLDVIVNWVSERAFPMARTAPLPSSTIRALRIKASNGSPALTETPILFGKDNRLFGILTELSSARRPDRPIICFLNSGADHHVGPHRMHVELARDLASRGYPTFRFDVAGIGESRVSTGDRENHLYSVASVADVRQAMTMLSLRRRGDRFVLVGLCAGAYLAFQSTIDDPRVVGHALLSPVALDWRDGDAVAPTARSPVFRDYASSLLDKGVWLRVLRGEVDFVNLARFFKRRLFTSARAELVSFGRSLGHQPHSSENMKAILRTMDERGVWTLVVSGSADEGPDEIATHAGYRALRAGGVKNLSFHVIEGADHTFKGSAAQHRLRDLLQNYLIDHFP